MRICVTKETFIYANLYIYQHEWVLINHQTFKLQKTWANMTDLEYLDVNQ